MRCSDRSRSVRVSVAVWNAMEIVPDSGMEQCIPEYLWGPSGCLCRRKRCMGCVWGKGRSGLAVRRMNGM